MTNPDKFLAATIVDRRAVADDLFVLHVDTGGDFSFLAGQYATLGVEVDSKRIERPYSICSSPYEKNLEFFVERVPEGELTPILYAMDKGAPLLLRRLAKGRFTLDLRSGRKNHFLLATVFFYAMAVLAYAGDFAFGRRAPRTASQQAAPVAAEAKVAVGAGVAAQPAAAAPETAAPATLSDTAARAGAAA